MGSLWFKTVAVIVIQTFLFGQTVWAADPELLQKEEDKSEGKFHSAYLQQQQKNREDLIKKKQEDEEARIVDKLEIGELMPPADTSAIEGPLDTSEFEGSGVEN